jgi:hypothetical protein
MPQVASFIQVFQLKFLKHFSSVPYVSHAVLHLTRVLVIFGEDYALNASFLHPSKTFPLLRSFSSALCSQISLIIVFVG